MSIPSSVIQTVLKQLQGRMIVTFSTTTDTNFTAYPVACIFGTLQGFTFLPMSNPSAQSQVNNLIVYDQFYQRLETLDGSLCCVMSSVILGVGLAQMHKPNPSVVSNEQFSITSNGQVQYEDSTGVVTLYAYHAPYLMFCSAGNTYCPNSSRNNLKLLNWSSLSDLQTEVGAVQDTTTLCCYNDDENRVRALLSWTLGESQQQSVYPYYSSLTACQTVDTKCICPTNNLCWMFNGSTVPCCIQGNPSDPRFAPPNSPNSPLIITQSQQECVNKALDCAQWRFNTVDVPCCVQRTPQQWSNAGYSTTGLQLFDSKSDCDAAAAKAGTGTCTFQNLVTPLTTSADYYGLILENQYTGTTCEPLRTAKYWGSRHDYPNLIESCAADVNRIACLSANCLVNNCSLWQQGNNTSPYVFTQNVRCLPPAEQCPPCPSGQTLTPVNPGQPTVTLQCK